MGSRAVPSEACSELALLSHGHPDLPINPQWQRTPRRSCPLAVLPPSPSLRRAAQQSNPNSLLLRDSNLHLDFQIVQRGVDHSFLSYYSSSS